MTIVLDASMTLAWVFERGRPPEAERADRLLAACGVEPWCVPSLWYLEVANALVVAERRAVISPGTSEDFLDRLRSLPIENDPRPLADRQPRILSLARTYRLSAYDATYLELAHRLPASLASFDGSLNQAAVDLGVELVG